VKSLLAGGLALALAAGCAGRDRARATAPVVTAAAPRSPAPKGPFAFGNGAFSASLRVVNESGRPDAEVEDVARRAIASGAAKQARAHDGATPIVVTITIGEPADSDEGLCLAVLVAGELERGGCRVFQFDQKLTMQDGKMGKKGDFDDLLRSAVEQAPAKLEPYARNIPATCEPPRGR
jgi:hypothetical protein